MSRSTWLHLAISPLAGALLLSSCRSGADDAAPDAGRSPSAPAATSSSAIVTADACGQWAGHGVDVIVEAMKSAAAKCPPSQRDPILAKWEGSRAMLRASAKAQCIKSVGAAYAATDARCYSEAKTIPALLGCHFAPLTSPGDSDLERELARIEQCGAGPAASAKPAVPM